MKIINFEGEEIKVLKVSGYNDDGCYWDMNAEIEFRGEIFSLVDAGSCYGYIPHCEIITKGKLERLYGKRQGRISKRDWSYFEKAIQRILRRFLNSGARESWEYREIRDCEGRKCEECWENRDCGAYESVDGVRI